MSPRARDSVGTFEDLHESATRACGLSDFGDEEYVEPLRVLLASYEKSAGLTPYDAASVGAWLHGAAATIAADDGPLVAGDVANAIPAAVRAVLDPA